MGSSRVVPDQWPLMVDVHTSSIPWLFCMAVVASGLGGALGMASGIFIVPLLIIVAGLDIHVAIGASLISVIACSCGSAGPAMDTALRLPLKVSSATSNYMIGVTATASAAAYFMRGAIVPSIAGPVALGSVVGALVGAQLLVVISADKLRVVFVAVLLMLALAMVFAALGVLGGGLA
jgi:uncharacterized membrane protein YfcA